MAGLWVIRAAAKAKLLDEPLASKLSQLNKLDTEDLSNFLFDPAGDSPLAKAAQGVSEDDLMTLYYLADRMVERAAKLTAINLSSVALKSGKGRNPCRPICIVAEGTTFYKLTSLKQRVEYYLKQYLVDKKNVFYQITAVDNATLIGAAIAGLTN